MPPFERIIACTFETLEGPHDFIVEIMGRHSNLILVSGGLIIGAAKHIGADRSRVREVLPQRPYVQPPQPRPDPETITAVDLEATPPDRPAWRGVLEAAAGIGPAMAWSICLRAGIDPARPLPPSAHGVVVDALHALGDAVRTGLFAPVLYRSADGSPAAYAPFPLEGFAGLQAEPTTMSAAVEVVMSLFADEARLTSIRQGLGATVARAADRVRRTHDAVGRDLQDTEDAARLRQSGELILAYLARVTPDSTILEVPGFDGAPMRIAIDPARSGVENAQAYFRRYARAAAARKRLPDRLAGLEAELRYLDAAATSIAQAETEDDLWELEQDLIAAGLRRAHRHERLRPRGADTGRVFALPGGHRVRVGRSARENDHLTFDVAGSDDLWLHARGMPGAHVILTGGQGGPTEEAIEGAARIAAYYSAGRGAAKVPVDVTRRRFVRRIRGAAPGQVHYSDERTVTVRPELPGRPRGRTG
jgi:predicted ribosome quality control (RQC) complex YloA/Tae2 family protein